MEMVLHLLDQNINVGKMSKKKLYYHTGISGRIRFVTLSEHKGVEYTSDGIKASTIALKPASELLGALVCRKVDGKYIYGRLRKVCTFSTDYVQGKYYGNNLWSTFNAPMKNEYVGVYWSQGQHARLPYWQNVNNLEFVYDHLTVFFGELFGSNYKS